MVSPCTFGNVWPHVTTETWSQGWSDCSWEVAQTLWKEVAWLLSSWSGFCPGPGSLSAPAIMPTSRNSR